MKFFQRPAHAYCHVSPRRSRALAGDGVFAVSLRFSFALFRCLSYPCLCFCGTSFLASPLPVGRRGRKYPMPGHWGEATETNATPRGFEPLRAEPNGFRAHLLSRSDTVSCRQRSSPTPQDNAPCFQCVAIDRARQAGLNSTACLCLMAGRRMARARAAAEQE